MYITKSTITLIFCCIAQLAWAKDSSFIKFNDNKYQEGKTYKTNIKINERIFSFSRSTIEKPIYDGKPGVTNITVKKYHIPVTIKIKQISYCH